MSTHRVGVGPTRDQLIYEQYQEMLAVKHIMQKFHKLYKDRKMQLPQNFTYGLIYAMNFDDRFDILIQELVSGLPDAVVLENFPELIFKQIPEEKEVVFEVAEEFTVENLEEQALAVEHSITIVSEESIVNETPTVYIAGDSDFDSVLETQDVPKRTKGRKVYNNCISENFNAIKLNEYQKRGWKRPKDSDMFKGSPTLRTYFGGCKIDANNKILDPGAELITHTTFLNEQGKPDRRSKIDCHNPKLYAFYLFIDAYSILERANKNQLYAKEHHIKIQMNERDVPEKDILSALRKTYNKGNFRRLWDRSKQPRSIFKIGNTMLKI